VLHGRWKKIDPGYGRSVLGYFGHPPLPPDPEVVKIASEQLELEPFAGSPLDAAPDRFDEAKKALSDRGLPTDEKSVFLVMSAMVPGKKMELNEGLRLLMGKPKIDLPLKSLQKKKEAAKAPAAAPAPAAAAAFAGGPVTTTCVVEEGGEKRTFMVTLEMPGAAAEAPAAAAEAASDGGMPVFSPFAGDSPVVELFVKEGDAVSKGQKVAEVEAMKAKHTVSAPVAGKVKTIHVDLGDEVGEGKPIMTIAPGA
jgi:pyruvate carboxylase subunit B